MEIIVGDRVLVRFSIEANKKGYAGKTDYAKGTIDQKVITRHCFEPGQSPDYTTTYLIKFDEEYFLERSDEDKERWIYPEERKYITDLVFTEETKELCCSYLKPKIIYKI